MTAQPTEANHFEHLLAVVANERFLSKQGPGNEIPFFIFPYTAGEAFEIDSKRKRLIRKLESRANPVSVLDINLFDLSLELLQKREILDSILKIESLHSKNEIRELLQGVLDPAEHLVPQISKLIHSIEHQVIFLSGFGEIYPYVRSHKLLNNLQRAAKDRPTVIFFPGSFTQSLASGASLDLFGMREDDKYYRAFNILNYEV
jgi:hypothetical protein